MDQKARKILLDTYWTSAGWRTTPATAPADLEYARQAGYMFDPVVLSHDEIVQWLGRVTPSIRPQQVADAFLASLSTRRCDLRSALGSYAMARHFPDHTFQAAGWCPVCGLRASNRIDLSVLNFERHKWGGVRHSHPAYNAFDLEQFLAIDMQPPTPQDLAILRQILEAAQHLPAQATPRDLERRLAKVLPSNKTERQVLLQILGYCGILQPAGFAGFFDGFTPTDQRVEPPGQNDWSYPVWNWRGQDGVHTEALRFFFPQLAALNDDEGG